MAVYIAHYYPPEDFDRFFRVGKCVDIIGPTFTSYAEAASQIGEELTDIEIQNLPVAPYIIKATPTEHGYKVLETYGVEEAGGRASNGYRAANGRRAGAAATPPAAVFQPFGTFEEDAKNKGKMRVVAKPLVGLSVAEDKDPEYYSPDDIAAKYGAFMARYAPGAGDGNAKRRIPLNKLEKAFRDTYLPEAEKQKRAEANVKAQERRKQAEKKVTEGVQTKVQASGGNIDKAIDIANKQVESVEQAVSSGQITSKEAAPIVAAHVKEKEILEVLKDFCPQHDEEALLRSLKKIVAMSFGGTPEAQEAAEVVVENVKNDLEIGIAEASEVEAPEMEIPAEPEMPFVSEGSTPLPESVVAEATEALLPKRRRGRPAKIRTPEEIEEMARKAQELENRRAAGLPVRGRRPKSVTTEEIPPVVAEHLTPDPTTVEEKAGVEVAKELLSQTLDAEVSQEMAKAETIDPTVTVVELPPTPPQPSAEDKAVDKAADAAEDKLAAERERLRLESEREEEEDAEYEREVARRLLEISTVYSPETYVPSSMDINAEVDKLMTQLTAVDNDLRDLSDVAPEIADRLPDPAAILRDLKDTRRLQGTQSGEQKVAELRKRIAALKKSVDTAISDQAQKNKRTQQRVQEIIKQPTKPVAPPPMPPSLDDLPDFDDLVPPSKPTTVTASAPDLDDLFGDAPAPIISKKLF